MDDAIFKWMAGAAAAWGAGVTGSIAYLYTQLFANSHKGRDRLDAMKKAYATKEDVAHIERRLDRMEAKSSAAHESLADKVDKIMERLLDRWGSGKD